MTLKEIPQGTVCNVLGVHLPAQLQRRLQVLGVLPGTALQVLNNKKHGAMVIKLRGSRFAIGREIAQNIDVEVPHHGWKK